MTGYTLSIYDADDELVHREIPVPFLPHPGLRIIYAGEVWEVRRVQVLVAEVGSVAHGNAEPPMVEVVAERGHGIHR